MAEKYVVILNEGMNYGIEPRKITTEEASDMLTAMEHIIGCSCTELVRPVGLKGDYAFFVDDNGHANGRNVNLFATALYTPDEVDGDTIVGKAVVVKFFRDGTTDWLDESDIEKIKKLVKEATDRQMIAFHKLLSGGGMRTRNEE